LIKEQIHHHTGGINRKFLIFGIGVLVYDKIEVLATYRTPMISMYANCTPQKCASPTTYSIALKKVWKFLWVASKYD